MTEGTEGHLDAMIRQTVDAKARQHAPHWFDADGDATWVLRIQRLESAKAVRHRPVGWRRAVGALLVAGGIFAGGSQLLMADSAIPPRVQLAAGISQIINNPVSVQQTTVTHTGSHMAMVVNHGPGRWRSVGWRQENGQWLPVNLRESLDGIIVTYRINTGPTTPGVTLSHRSKEQLVRQLKSDPDTSQVTVAGALQQLPVVLPKTTETKAGPAKVLLRVNSRRAVLALIYPVSTTSGQRYVPDGFYWWRGAPVVLKGIAATWTFHF